MYWLNREVAADEGEIIEAGEGEGHVKEKKAVLERPLVSISVNFGLV